jgi:predicted negative regulator of RcsB-dependent stress response
MRRASNPLCTGWSSAFDSALLHVFKGDVLAARKATDEALAEYKRALAIDPRWPDIHPMIGSCWA